MTGKIKAPSLTSKSGQSAKAQATHDAAVLIIDTEADARAAKTKRLRAARLKAAATAEAETPVLVATKKPKSAKKI